LTYYKFCGEEDSRETRDSIPRTVVSIPSLASLYTVADCTIGPWTVGRKSELMSEGIPVLAEPLVGNKLHGGMAEGTTASGASLSHVDWEDLAHGTSLSPHHYLAHRCGPHPVAGFGEEAPASDLPPPLGGGRQLRGQVSGVAGGIPPGEVSAGEPLSKLPRRRSRSPTVEWDDELAMAQESYHVLQQRCEDARALLDQADRKA